MEIPSNPEKRAAFMNAHGGPNWVPRTIEQITEAAAQVTPGMPFYEKQLSDASRNTRQPINFYRLLDLGIFEHVDAPKEGLHPGAASGRRPVRAQFVDFTPEGLDYCITAIGARIEEMQLIQDCLMARRDAQADQSGEA